MRLKKERCRHCKNRDGYLRKSIYTSSEIRTCLSCTKCRGEIKDRLSGNELLTLLGTGPALEDWLYLIQKCYSVELGNAISAFPDRLQVFIWEMDTVPNDQWLKGHETFSYGKKKPFLTHVEALAAAREWVTARLLEIKWANVPQL